MNNINEIEKIKSKLNRITMVATLDYYDNPCLVVLDAVMSRSRVYEKIVVPKIKYFKENHSDINTLEKLIAVMNGVGVELFASNPNFCREIQKVKGIGIATVRYLSILLNVDTMKPNVHVLKFLGDILDGKIEEQEANELLTVVAREMNKSVAIINNSIWQFMSNPNNADITSKLQSMTLEELMVIKEYVKKLI